MALSEDIDELKQDVIRLRAEAEGIACANPRVVGSLAAQQCPFLSAKRFKARHDCILLPAWAVCQQGCCCQQQHCTVKLAFHIPEIAVACTTTYPYFL